MKFTGKIALAITLAAMTIPLSADAFKLPSFPGIIDEAIKVTDKEEPVAAPADTIAVETTAPATESGLSADTALPMVPLLNVKEENGTDWRDANFQFQLNDPSGVGIGYATMYTSEYPITLTVEGETAVLTGKEISGTYMTDEYGGAPLRIVPGVYDAVVWKRGYQPVLIRIKVPGRLAEPVVLQTNGPLKVEFRE